jgi:hypothetical protein
VQYFHLSSPYPRRRDRRRGSAADGATGPVSTPKNCPAGAILNEWFHTGFVGRRSVMVTGQDITFGLKAESGTEVFQSLNKYTRLLTTPDGHTLNCIPMPTPQVLPLTPEALEAAIQAAALAACQAKERAEAQTKREQPIRNQYTDGIIRWRQNDPRMAGVHPVLTGHWR